MLQRKKKNLIVNTLVFEINNSLIKFRNMQNFSQKSIVGQSRKELEETLAFYDEKPFRGRQIFDWIYKKKIYDFSKMSDLPISLREKLKSNKIHPLILIKGEDSNTRKTKKFLFQLNNGEQVESVLMENGDRNTICLSTQVGCAVDCGFAQQQKWVL